MIAEINQPQLMTYWYIGSPLSFSPWGWGGVGIVFTAGRVFWCRNFLCFIDENLENLLGFIKISKILVHFRGKVMTKMVRKSIRGRIWKGPNEQIYRSEGLSERLKRNSMQGPHIMLGDCFCITLAVEIVSNWWLVMEHESGLSLGLW